MQQIDGRALSLESSAFPRHKKHTGSFLRLVSRIFEMDLALGGSMDHIDQMVVVSRKNIEVPAWSSLSAVDGQIGGSAEIRAAKSFYGSRFDKLCFAGVGIDNRQITDSGHV